MPARPPVNYQWLDTEHIEGMEHRICRALAQGKRLSEIAGKAGVPSLDAIAYRQATHKGFAEAVQRARTAAAQRQEDRVAQTVDQVLQGAVKPDAAAVAIKGLQWLARVQNPSLYGDSAQGTTVGVAVQVTMSAEDRNL